MGRSIAAILTSHISDGSYDVISRKKCCHLQLGNTSYFNTSFRFASLFITRVAVTKSDSRTNSMHPWHNKKAYLTQR